MPWMTIIGAGASLLGGSMQSDAAESAASTQSQSAEQSIAEQRRQFDLASTEQRRQYDQARADYAPFLKTGTAASKRLAQLLGLDSKTGARTREDWVGDNYRAGEGAPATTASLGSLTPDEAYADYVNRYEPEAGDGTGMESSPLLRNFTAADLEADPVYKSGLDFGLNEGRNAINARATAGSMFDSGATLKALTRFGSDYGSTKAGEAFNRFNTNQSKVFNALTGVSGGGQTAAGQVTSAGANMVNGITGAGSTMASNVGNAYEGAGNARAAGIVGGANAWGNAAGGVNNAVNNYQSNKRFDALMASRSPYYGDTGVYGYWGN